MLFSLMITSHNIVYIQIIQSIIDKGQGCRKAPQLLNIFAETAIASKSSLTIAGPKGSLISSTSTQRRGLTILMQFSISVFRMWRGWIINLFFFFNRSCSPVTPTSSRVLAFACKMAVRSSNWWPMWRQSNVPPSRTELYLGMGCYSGIRQHLANSLSRRSWIIGMRLYLADSRVPGNLSFIIQQLRVSSLGHYTTRNSYAMIIDDTNYTRKTIIRYQKKEIEIEYQKVLQSKDIGILERPSNFKILLAIHPHLQFLSGMAIPGSVWHLVSSRDQATEYVARIS